jgi:CRP-like cAMP-binding protein
LSTPASPSAAKLLVGLSKGEQSEVLSASLSKDLRRGQTLFHQDEPAEALYLVEAGRLKLTQLTASGQTVTVRVVGVGELCAAIAVLDGKAYPFTASATEDSKLRLWPRARLREVFRRVPRLESNVLDIVGAHTREMMDRFRELATEPVPQRVARALLRLAQTSGQRTAEGVVIEGVTQQELAELTAATLYTVNRILAEWESDGVLSRGRGRIVIHSEPRLQRLCEP